MEQRFVPERLRESWKGKALPWRLAGDVSAAAVSASFVAPIITAIDRAVVESAVSSRVPLFQTLKTHVLCSFRHPKLFFNAKPFFIVWTLYAATYTTANASDTLAKAFVKNADQVLVGSISFLSTCAVNVPLGVWKDVRFVHLYGRPVEPNPIMNTPAANALSSPAKRGPISAAPKVPKIVGATFLLRDIITIFGSFTLPPLLCAPFSETLLSNPIAAAAAAQLLVPVLSQVVATPVHILGLDLYNQPRRQGTAERMSRITRNLGPTTAMRCCRIIPAFGFGCIMNTNLRNHFHQKAGSGGID